MRKFTVFAALLSLLTLSVFSGCDSSSSSSSSGDVTPPASDTTVGLYKITKIVSTNVIPDNFDTSKPEQILYFDGEMAIINNTLKIEGKYQIVGYSEYALRAATPDTPAKKYVTYNKFSADNASVANMKPTSTKDEYTLNVTDNAGIALELTVMQQNHSSLASINYQPWVSVASQGNSYWKNDAFYDDNILVPTRLIGNYMITKVVIEKNGQTVTVDHDRMANKLIGELAVTAQLVEGKVKLVIVIKLQTDPTATAGTNFKEFIFETLTDVIPVTHPLDIEKILADEGMVIVQGSNTEVLYSPKKRAADGVTFEDLMIDGALVKLHLSKIIQGALMDATPKKVLTDVKYY